MAVVGGRLLTTALPGKPETTALATAMTPITSPVGAQGLLYSTPIRIGVSDVHLTKAMFYATLLYHALLVYFELAVLAILF